MNRQTISNIPHFFLLITLLLFSVTTKGQCSITASDARCVGEPITFNCNAIGATNHNWNFNSEGSSTGLCSPGFVFNSPGSKTITLSLTLVNGNTCNATLVINVIAKPTISLRRLSNRVQCFNNNSFCFVDSSAGPGPQDTICHTITQFDDGTKYEFNGKGPRTFCHSFQDPAGGTYGVTVEVKLCNGCSIKRRYNAIAVVLPSMQLSFTSPQPKKCDSVQLCITNKSVVPLDSISSFEWDWGDGNKTTGSKNTPNLWQANIPNGVCHWFKTMGPSNGNFNTMLKVTTNFGCTETFTYNGAATNLLNNPVIIADYDSICSSGTINFKLKDGPIPGAANPLFAYDQPFIPTNFTRNWTGSHKFDIPGPYQVSFSFTHPLPGCGRTVYDTILVLGPQSVIEGSVNSGMSYIPDSIRYQCIIRDTVKLSNYSRFYHNDGNMRDDDSTLIMNSGFNRPLVHAFTNAVGLSKVKPYKQLRGPEYVARLWDFGDEYCEQCTTDSRLGINTTLNCRYSKDSLPKHWYTPWEDLYENIYAARPEEIPVYNKDSGVYYIKHLWSDDSVAIIRDTILYYGDNPLARTSKDSTVYDYISNKIMVSQGISGVSSTDYSKASRIYIIAGDSVYINKHDGLPNILYKGPRYLDIQAGWTLVITSKTDRALNHVWLEFTQDTIPLSLVKTTDKIWKKQLNKDCQAGDSINAAAHRQRFYNGQTVKCYAIKLTQKDMAHPMACTSEAVSMLSLQPPSAKRMRKSGVQCLGGDQDNYGITFILDDTKPGCSLTWAEINFDTAMNKNAWVPAVGKNLGPGQISAGDLPPVNPPYGVPLPGYPVNGPAPKRFSRQFTIDDIKDSINGYINVGLITGNGIWPNGNYPQACQDTVYYRHFARFPMLDNRFSIIKPASSSQEYTKLCKRDTLQVAPTIDNRTNVGDVEEAVWSLSTNNAGKYFAQPYSITVTETYRRFTSVHPDTPYLVDKLTVVRRSTLDSRTSVLDSQEYRIAKVTAWHYEADISSVFDQVKSQLQAYGIDVYDLNPTELASQIWNGKGTIGKPYTGSKGLIDTTGFGKNITVTAVSDARQILHFKDTSLLPVDQFTGPGGTYHAYGLVPLYHGLYAAGYSLKGTNPNLCKKENSNFKKVIVGFYDQLTFYDTVLCHDQNVVASLFLRNFHVYPEICFCTTDPIDYWSLRIAEAGLPNREGITRTDLNEADDDKSKPNTIFGAFPYAVTGIANFGGGLQLGGLPGGIYYNQDTGASYIIRTAVSDSSGCHDTLSQEIFTTAVRAKFKLDQTRPQCNTIIELFDSSYIIDPYKARYGNPADEIVRWTVYWGDNSSNAIQDYYAGSYPPKITHAYTRNGFFTIKWRVQTYNGCIDWDSTLLYIPGPRPEFTFTSKDTFCTGEEIVFSNTSKYLHRDSSIWTWSFGDGTYGSQYDTITPANDTISHRFNSPGTFQVYLYHSFQFIVGTTKKRCTVIYPDTSNGQGQPVTVNVKECNTGLHELNTAMKICMYPNPAYRTLTLVVPERMEIHVLDVTGHTVQTFFAEGTAAHDMKGLAPGLYFIANAGGQLIGKLIME